MAFSRRFFFGAAAAAAGLPRRAQALTSWTSDRLSNALKLRTGAAQQATQRGQALQLVNQDEARFPSRFAVFTKTLPHNELGEPNVAAYDALVRALESGSVEELDRVPGKGRLVNPIASYCFGLEGLDVQQYSCTPPPAFDSPQFGAETAELYWQALARDVAFDEYATSPLVAAACEELTSMGEFAGARENGSVTPQTVFRSPVAGAVGGPYISQFLFKDVPYGTTPMPQRYRTCVPGRDYATDYAEWLSLQDGNPPASRATFDPVHRYIRNGRDLSTYVWQDFSYQAFLNAALILIGMGSAVTTDANPYKIARRQAGFSTFGGPMVLDLVARVANAALRATWWQKWLAHRRLRPEETGGRLHTMLSGRAVYPLPANLLNARAVAAVHERYGTWLLPQAYPEGAPGHPSFAAGHAAIAGACVTVLKAFYQPWVNIPDPVVPSADGTRLIPYEGSLTIGGELNKLATNIGVGRHFAGIHYLSDAEESLRLGEAVAISILQDSLPTMAEQFGDLQFTSFDGKDVVIARTA